MHVDTVGNRFVDALYSGLGGTIYLPGVMRYAAMLVSSQWLLLFPQKLCVFDTDLFTEGGA